MSDNINDIYPLPDDELNEVSGGTNAEDVAAQAAADGRTIMLPAGNFMSDLCICAHHNKWAREKKDEPERKEAYYYDIKCYKCGKVWPKKFVDTNFLCYP